MKDRSYLIYVVFIALMAILIFGCKTQAPVPIQYKERIVERLVPVTLPADSSSIKALFECDSLNNVVMRELNESKTKGVESQVSFTNGWLNYHTVTIHDTVYVAAKDSIIYKEVPFRVEVPVEVNKLTQWQILQIWAGRALFALVLVWIGLSYFKRFTTAFK
jgi:hypothetical protein